MSKSDEIEKMLAEYLDAIGAVNIWWEGEEDGDEEDRLRDLVRSFLSEDTLVVDQQVELIYQRGGGEGSGEHVEAVFKLFGIYYKATWNYYSHFGFDWDGLEFEEVVPFEKTVTVYESIA